jgi:hypothetical protein
VTLIQGIFCFNLTKLDFDFLKSEAGAGSSEEWPLAVSEVIKQMDPQPCLDQRELLQHLLQNTECTQNQPVWSRVGVSNLLPAL